METTVKFWDRIADRYAAKPIEDEAAYQKKLAVTREYLRPDSDVLEFGCGTGSTAILHAPYVRHIRATDISGKMIDIGRRNAAAANIENIRFEQTSIDALEAADESFDVVLGLSILHLLPDREPAIRRVYRMLKPGGVFITSTVCLGDWLRIFKLIGPVGRFFGLMPLVRVFTSAELVASITAADFEIEHRWQPAKNKAVFVVARKPET